MFLSMPIKIKPPFIKKEITALQPLIVALKRKDNPVWIVFKEY